MLNVNIKYVHVTFLFGIIKQITHGSEGDGTDYQPFDSNYIRGVSLVG